MSATREMMVGSVIAGLSQYDDAVWKWLGDHADFFDPCGDVLPDLVDGYDFWRACGLFVLAGCSVKGYDNEDAPPPYTGWGEGFYITFAGTAEELIARLNWFLPNAHQALSQAQFRERHK